MEENLTQIKQDTMMFFDGHREVFPIYEAFENRLFHLGKIYREQKTTFVEEWP